MRVSGWNLPTGSVTMDANGAGPGTAMLTVRRGAIVSNRVPFALDALREIAEREPNNAPNEAGALALPVVVNGRIALSGDVDVFAVKGRAGDRIVVEVTARRLGSPLDSVARDRRRGGRADCAERRRGGRQAAGLMTHQADSRLMVALPAAGACYVRIGDLRGKGGPEYGYRLRVGAPQPDFDVRITPADHQRGRRHQRGGDGACHPEGRIRGRHRAGAGRRAARVHAERRRGAGRPWTACGSR